MRISRAFAVITMSVLALSSCAQQTASDESSPLPAAENTVNPENAPASITSPNNSADLALETTSTSFAGLWNRTGVVRQSAANLRITGEMGKSFNFSLAAYWGDHVGVLSGKAEKLQPDEAIYAIKANDDHDAGTLRFTLENSQEPRLDLTYEGDHNALDFGRNVVPDGAYVKGKPEYESDGYPMLVLGSAEVLFRVKTLMTSTNEKGDDTAYKNLLYVMREGLPTLVEPNRYMGFITSGWQMGADLYISPSGHIYIMAYGLDERKLVFYTTDVDYHGWLKFPEFLDIEEDIDEEEVEFAYNGDVNAIIPAKDGFRTSAEGVEGETK